MHELIADLRRDMCHGCPRAPPEGPALSPQGEAREHVAPWQSNGDDELNRRTLFALDWHHEVVAAS